MASNSNIGLGQVQTQTQQLNLTPEQILVIKMVELPNADLEERIMREVQENPALELGNEPEQPTDKKEENDYSQDDDLEDLYGDKADREDVLQNADFDYRTYVDDDDPNDEPWERRYNTSNFSPDDEVEEAPIVQDKTFTEYLTEQVEHLRLPAEQRKLALYVVLNIDDRGYLTSSVEQMVDDLAFKNLGNVSDEAMAEAVEIVRHLDPIGTGARDLQDCLLMQLRSKPESEATKLAIQLVTRNMEDLGKHHYDRLINRYNVAEELFQQALEEIRHCVPHPSNAFNGDFYGTRKSRVAPDFSVEQIDGELVVSLCDDNVPAVHVTPEYKEQLASYLERKKLTKAEREGRSFLREKVESANMFINAIRQRNETLMKTMCAIVNYQSDFFLYGVDSHLKPMILADIAKETGLDASTVSRVSNSKFVQTDFGVFPLKHFFSEALKRDDGEHVSSKEVKHQLLQLIEQEDKRNPLADDKLEMMLRDKGYNVARRTVAKYRRQLGIPISGQRKQLKTD